MIIASYRSTRRIIVSYENLFAAEETTYGLISFIVDEIAD